MGESSIQSLTSFYHCFLLSSTCFILTSTFPIQQYTEEPRKKLWNTHKLQVLSYQLDNKNLLKLFFLKKCRAIMYIVLRYLKILLKIGHWPRFVICPFLDGLHDSILFLRKFEFAWLYTSKVRLIVVTPFRLKLLLFQKGFIPNIAASWWNSIHSDRGKHSLARINNLPLVLRQYDALHTLVQSLDV